MPAYRTQQDLLDYITDLEERIAKLERSAVRISVVASRTSAPPSGPARTAGRIIFETGSNKLYAADGTNWNALW